MTTLNNSDLGDDEDLLFTALKPLSRGEELDERLVKYALRSATAAVMQTLSSTTIEAEAELSRLERAYWFLAAHTEGEYDHAREFVLGRIATMVDLVAAAAPVMSSAEVQSMLDVKLEEGTTKLDFLRAIATGPKQPSEMAQYVPFRAESRDQGNSAASRHLKQLMLAGYLHRERQGRDVYYRLTIKGHEAVQKFEAELTTLRCPKCKNEVKCETCERALTAELRVVNRGRDADPVSITIAGQENHPLQIHSQRLLRAQPDLTPRVMEAKREAKQEAIAA